MNISRLATFGRMGLAALVAVSLSGCLGGGEGGGVTIGGITFGGTTTPPVDTMAELAAQAKPEQCALCHSGDMPVANTGPLHQAEYAKYADASKFTLTVDGVSSVLNADNTTYTSTLTFTAMKSGVPLTAAQVAALPQHTFYAVPYDSTTRQFGTSFSYSGGTTVGNYTATGTPGQFTVKQTKAAFAPESTNAEAYAYIADGKLDTEGMTLYDDVANAGKAYGNVTGYQSAANVEACETCHGKPYMKHGYRMAKVSGLSDFGACKNCHYDSRAGHDLNWQIMKDNPTRAAEIAAGSALTTEENTKYAYKAKLINDVHMSHAMEFPYPQAMQSCVTCHAGKLGNTAANDIFADDKFKAETCVSCHAVDGLKTKMTKKTSTGATITIHDTFVAKMDDPAQRDTVSCTTCHGKAAGIGPSFASIHKNGYDPKIYATDGTRYSDTFVVTIDSTTLTNNVLDIKFSATGSLGSLSAANITPTILVGLYGYNTKDFIVAAHGTNADGKRNLEYIYGSTATTNATTRFTPVSKTTVGATTTWNVTANLSGWADMITAGKIKRAEVAVLPELKNGTTVLGLNAPSKTFNLTSNGFENYFSDIVKVAKTTHASTGSVDGCNSCHDQLATTFHSGIRGGNIKVCRICHEVSSAGSHLELQSRSIDSYVHAIHSFQAFDPGDINYDDPTEVFEYEEHISHHFPRFTIKNCEACHNTGMYNVPDQAKSMPGVLSGSDVINGSNVNVQPAVTGPATRACGACHRAQAIGANNGLGDAGRLATQRSHWQTFGYYIEVAAADTRALWEQVVANLQSLFQ